MNKSITVAACLVACVCLADRVDTWLASSVVVSNVTLTRLPAGGCSATAVANVTTSLGKTVQIVATPATLAGANLTECLDILDVKAPVLFKNDQGL